MSFDLYDHQKRGLEFVRARNGRAGLWMEMGTGKSRIALAHLTEQDCQRVLVVCPLSAVGVWQREARIVGLPHTIVDLTGCGTIKDRTVALKKTDRKVPTIVICNFESYWREPLRAAVLRWEPDAVIIDEAHRIKNRGTRQSRFAHILGDREHVKVKLALTGTPVTNGLEDLWSMFRFISPNIFGSWTSFQNTYLVMGGYQGRQIIRYRNVTGAHDIVAKTAFQCTKAEAIDLPERQDILIPVTLTPNTMATYDELRRKAITMVQTGAGPRPVIAQLVLTLLLRLQQITSGFAREVGGETIDLSTEKADVALDLIANAHAGGEKVVVFARFLHDLDAMQVRLPKTLRVARFDGSVSSHERTAILERFRHGEYDVLLVQIRAGSLGIDLTAASIAIFFSTGFSLDDFLQARDRLHRIGQLRKVTYFHLIATGTVDVKVYDALRNKQSIARRATDLSYAVDLLR